MRVFGLLFLLFSSVAVAGWFGPSSYDECVIEKLKEFDGAVPKLAQGSVRRVCSERFPSPKITWDDLIKTKQYQDLTPSQKETVRKNYLNKHGWMMGK